MSSSASFSLAVLINATKRFMTALFVSVIVFIAEFVFIAFVTVLALGYFNPGLQKMCLQIENFL